MSLAHMLQSGPIPQLGDAMNLIIREMDLSRDAEGIARMFNESDLAWPGTFIEGQPMTAEMIREWQTDQAFLAVYLAEVDGEIAGFASFMEGDEGQPGEGYLDLLNVNPKFHGLSIGRKLVQTCINRAAKEGFRRHGLGTWSNNLKAVPAYKKTGHFWRPETSVWMENYVPTVLQMPICKPFFERHDWYDTYARQVSQNEDDFRWEGVKVYPMRWQAAGESLAVWIDREAQAVVAVETDGLFVAAIPQAIEALHGEEVQINWRITNKTDTVQRFSVDARGADGLEIDHREMFVVQAGATVEHVAAVKVTAEAPFAKEYDIAPAVRSVITFGHDDVELFSGIRARRPVEISTDVAELSVAPQQPQTILLQVQNRQRAPIQGVMRLAPAEGLAVSWREHAVEVAAGGYLTLPVVVTSEGERVYALEARLTIAGQDQPVTETLQLFSVGVGGLVTQSDAKSARIESDGLRLTVAAKRGVVTLTDKATRQMLANLGPTMGPPYSSTEMHRREFSVAVEQVGARAVVQLAAESKAQPGLVLRERVTVAPTGLVEVSGWLENHGEQTREAAVRLGIERGDTDLLQMAVPLPDGIVVANASWWPRLHGDISRDPAAYAEPWQAWQGRGIAAGVAWGAGVQQVRVEWRITAAGVVQALAAGERSKPVTVALYGQPDDWQDVRPRLNAWAGIQSKALPVRAMAEAVVEPRLILTDQDTVQARVRAESVMNRAFDARVELACEQPLAADWRAFDAPGLIQGQPAERPVTLSLPAGQTGLYSGVAQLAFPNLHSNTPFAVARVGLGGEVRVSQEQDRGHDVWRVDNGLAQFRVAADYGPSVYSWQVGGQEQLHSHFPDVRGLAWMHPYFGGLHPLLVPKGSWCYEGFMHKGLCSAAPVQATDRWGLCWSGVRVSARHEQEQLRDLLVEIDVLTVGRSPLLKVIYRIINQRDAAQECVMGLNAMPSLGAAVEDLVLVGADAWHQDSLIGNRRWGQRWGAVVNPHDGHAALLVSDREAVGLWATAQVGRLFSGGREVRLAARETHETTYYLVLADTLEQAKRYIALQDA
jgi:GNAT superfamily N-acetyltransferase